MKKYTIFTLAFSLILLIASGVLIWLENQYTFLHIPRMIIGSVVVLGVPGYWITRWAFPLYEQERMLDPYKELAKPREEDAPEGIDGLERFVLSVALSISAVPLTLFYVNFLGVPLTVWSVYWTIT